MPMARNAARFSLPSYMCNGDWHANDRLIVSELATHRRCQRASGGWPPSALARRCTQQFAREPHLHQPCGEHPLAQSS